MPTLRLTLPFHPAQLQVFQDTHRFRAVAANRRWGKNILGAGEMITAFLRGGVCWAIANDYPSGAPMFRLLTKLTADLPGVQVNKSDRIITCPRLSVGYIQLRSVGANLRGEGLDFVLFDEVIDIKDFVEVWQGDISPTLANTGGRAMFISSVFTFDHFWDLVLYAQTSGDPDWRAWIFDYTSTPTITPQEIARQKRNLSPARFSREFLSIPVTLGSVFALDDDNKSATPQETAIEGHNYIVGCDIGGAVDPTVYAVIDLTLQELVHLDAFLIGSFTRQVARLKDMCDRFNPSAVIVETNNAGEAFRQEAEAAGVKYIRALVTSNASKSNQVESLVMAFEQHKFKVIDDITLVSQFAAFESQKTASGLVRYAAAKGHDDHVLAALIAWAGADTSHRVFDNFSPDRHVTNVADYIDTDIVQHPIFWTIQDGYSFGNGPGRADYRPRVVLVAQRADDGGLNVIGELYQCNEPDYQITFGAALAMGFRAPSLVFVDKTGSTVYSAVCQYAQRVLLQVTAADCEISEGIRCLRSQLESGRLRIHPRCQNLLREIQAYQYAPPSASGGESRPVPIDDGGPTALARLAWKQRFQ